MSRPAGGQTPGTPSALDAGQVVEWAGLLAGAAGDRPEAGRASELARRVAAGRFRISVVGEFKRGKSTLVNALVGEDVVPTGVLPLTAVSTELSYGEPAATVEYLDGTSEAVAPPSIAEYVSEARNPENVKGVARVLLSGRWPLLAGGAVLVDTPGTGSVHEHNTDAARAALVEADGAVVVLSADSPLSAAERDMLASLRARSAPTFFVLNKVDHLARADREQVRRFVTTAIEELVGQQVTLFEVDARARLADPAGPGRPDVFELPALAAELRRFISDDLVGALVARAARDLAGLARSLLEALNLEEAVLERDSEHVSELSRRFSAAATEQRRLFDDDLALMRRAVARLVEDSRSRLQDFSRREPPRYLDQLGAVAVEAPRRELPARLQQVIEAAVETSFGSFRSSELERVDREWQAAAERLRKRTEDRVAAIRSAAAELFTVDLPRVAVPPVSSERERFFYLFLHVGSTIDVLTGAASHLLPDRVARPRALGRAREELFSEFEKHAGRAGWDLEQRLEAAARRLQGSMEQEIDRTTAAVIDAAGRAEQRRLAAEAERARRAESSRHLRGLAESILARTGR